jgi:hypothetical protein
VTAWRIFQSTLSLSSSPVSPIEHGWNQPARGHIALGGKPTQEHEDYVIVSINPMLVEENQLRLMLAFVSDFLEQD